jgi:hypothetical protein
VGLALLILLCLIVGGLVVGWVLERLGVGWGAPISFFTGLLAKLAGGLAVGAIAVGAAQRGGIWYALAAALALAALAMFALVGVLAWGVLKYGIPED